MALKQCELCLYDGKPAEKFKYDRDFIRHMKDQHDIEISPTDGRAWKPDEKMGHQVD